jgi:hypothetical protein
MFALLPSGAIGHLHGRSSADGCRMRASALTLVPPDESDDDRACELRHTGKIGAALRTVRRIRHATCRQSRAVARGAVVAGRTAVADAAHRGAPGRSSGGRCELHRPRSSAGAAPPAISGRRLRRGHPIQALWSTPNSAIPPCAFDHRAGSVRNVSTSARTFVSK